VTDIKHNIEVDKLSQSKDILIVVLGKNVDAERLLKSAASYLISNGIDIYVPSALNSNVVNPKHPETNNDKFWEDEAVTISKIHRAKGNEADMVYVIGLDNVAAEESNINLRNQVFVALTRARGWVKLCGVGSYPMFDILAII
jgi:superfamily I DNA and RNA helicase